MWQRLFYAKRPRREELSNVIAKFPCPAVRIKHERVEDPAAVPTTAHEGGA